MDNQSESGHSSSNVHLTRENDIITEFVTVWRYHLQISCLTCWSHTRHSMDPEQTNSPAEFYMCCTLTQVHASSTTKHKHSAALWQYGLTRCRFKCFQCSPQCTSTYTYLVLKCHIQMFMIHFIQMYFGKPFVVIIGPVEHLGAGGVIVVVHSKLTTRIVALVMFLRGWASMMVNITGWINQKQLF